MDTHEVERIRSLWETYMRGSQWLEKPEALQALGAEVGLLLAIIDAQQAVVAAAGEVVSDVKPDNWYEDAFTYVVDAEALETLKREYDALVGMKGEDDARADGV